MLLFADILLRSFKYIVYIYIIYLYIVYKYIKTNSHVVAKVALLLKSENGRKAFVVCSLSTQHGELSSGFCKAITTESLNQKPKAPFKKQLVPLALGLSFLFQCEYFDNKNVVDIS